MTVPGIDDYVFTFEYTRELPVDDYYIGNQPNLEQADSKKEVGDSARILTMRSENYADVMDCFSPMYERGEGRGERGDGRGERGEGRGEK